MATEAEVKAQERRELLNDIRRRRAAAAQAEGSLGAAERGDYGEVGQGEPKGEFDDEINQDPSQSSMTQQAKNFLANYFTNAKFGATGAGIESMARIQSFLADKKIPFTDKDVTDIFMKISQAPNRETFTKEDIGKVIGMGEFVTEDMVGKNKPLTVGQVPGYLGNLVFGGTAEDMRKVRDEGLTVDNMTPGQRASMAAGFSEFTPFGLAPDIFRLGKAGINTGIKAIDDMVTPLNQMQTAGGPNVNMMANLSEEGSGNVKTTMGPAPKNLKPAADKWLQDNPGEPNATAMDVFLNEPDKYLKTGIVNIGNIKDRRIALGISTPEGKNINKLSAKRKENTFTDFKSNLEGVDMDDPQAILEAFRKSYKKGYKETTAAKQYEETGSLTTSQSANSQINELIDQFENTEGGFKILKQKEIDSLIPKTSANKAREVRESFKKFLVEAPQYKEIIKAYPGEAEYLKRYFNFIRESSLKKNRNPIKGKESSISPKQVNFDNFIKEYEVEFNDMLNPNSSFAKEYQEFKRVDVVRGKVSKLLQPFFDKVFPSGGKKSVQIAHRYMGSQIGNTVPAGVAGSGGSPMAYDLDLSMINYNIQPKLEELARRAVKNNDKKAMQDISSDATAIGAEFEINGIKFGEFRPLEEVIDNLIAEAMIDGKKIGLTDKMINDAMEASNMLRLEVGARQNLKDGGIVGISHLTRPLGNF